MKTVNKVIAGASDYQKAGYFVAENIVTYRCENCYQHMSFYNYAIDALGLVTPEVVCLNCEAIHSNLKLQGFDKKHTKKAMEVYLK